MDPGDPGEGPEDELAGLGHLLPPDDRLWRHPSELAGPARCQRPGVGWPIAIVSGLVGSVLTFGLIAATGALDGGGDREVVVRERVQPAGTGPASVADRVVPVAHAVRPAIVRIEVARSDRRGSGSGVMFRDDGYLVTNAHVVRDGGGIRVVLADGSELDGTLVGTDRVTDIAVVKVTGEQPFVTAALGSAADLRVGQDAIAIGSPLGLAGGSSVTTGVISALGRRVRNPEGPSLVDMIQTDAAIAPGSSGGALLDASGAVIGITTAIAVSEQGIEGLGFATPIDIARAVADDIIATGKAVHVWLGIEGSDLDRASADEAGVDGGAIVERVVPGSPAAGAGLAPRDIVVAVSDQPVTSMSGLVVALGTREPGERVQLGILRDERRSTVSAVLGRRPTDE
ncbi:MAG: S1C family serine protease [Acidimicrobiales bacterium]